MKKCLVEDCCNNINKGGRGYCGKHYMRLKRYGDLNYITPEHVRVAKLRASQPSLGVVKKTTYKKLFGRHEHRRVAEEKLGRALLSTEHVHHIDGNKHNNAYDNLVVMTRQAHLQEHANDRVGKPPLRGSKLTNAQVLEIRACKLPQGKIAELFGISQTAVSHIKTNKIYKYVK